MLFRSSNDATEEFNIHWYEPTKASRAKGGLFENMFFQEELDNMRIKGRLNGQPRYKLIPRLQDIGWDRVHFGFTKLKSSGGLPREVLTHLKGLGLITGKVKRT